MRLDCSRVYEMQSCLKVLLLAPSFVSWLCFQLTVIVQSSGSGIGVGSYCSFLLLNTSKYFLNYYLPACLCVCSHHSLHHDLQLHKSYSIKTLATQYSALLYSLLYICIASNALPYSTPRYICASPVTLSVTLLLPTHVPHQALLSSDPSH